MSAIEERRWILLSYFVAFSVLSVFLIQSKYGFVALSFLLVAYFFIVRGSVFSSNNLFVIIIFSFFTLPSAYVFQHGMSHFFYFFLTVACFLSAGAFSRLDVYSVFRIIQVVFFSYVVFAFVVYYVYRDLPEPFSGFVEGSSTNGIPSYLIVLQVVYSLLCYSVKKRLPVFPAILTLIVALLGIGRGSIYVAFLIVALSFIINFYIDIMSKRYFSIIGFFCLFLALIGVVLINIDSVYAFLDGRTKALHGIVDPYRNRIAIEYFLSLQWWQIIIGGEYKDTVISDLYDNNPHISFIRSHAYFGIFYTLALMLSPFFFFFKSRSYLYSIVFFSFTLLLLLRALSEPIFFPTALDFFYYLIFYAYYRYVFKAKTVMDMK